MTELEKIISELSRLDILKISFSCPYDKKGKFKKCTARKLDGDVYQFESFTETQAFHENVSTENLCEKVNFVVENLFRQAEVFTDEYVYGIKLSSGGRVLHNRRKNTLPVSKGNEKNNRKKNYIMDLENAPPVFEDIGIFDKNGKIINSKYDKYKQIERFCEFIDDVVKKDPREEYFIVDFGCGKSYLTFVCYHYLTKIANKKAEIVGLDLKEKVIDDCNALSKKYGYDGLSFLCMDIKDYVPKKCPDMVIALHACDTATDYALYNAYRWQTDYIFSVPCCQHELNAKIKTDSFSVMTSYGLIKERFSALATDALRAKTLEYMGYKTDVLEFIDMEHSPKNILLRAVRATGIKYSGRKRILAEIERFEKEFNAKLFLHSKITEGETEKVINGKNFLFVSGRASMLIKDSLAVRNAVFGKELNGADGAVRDGDDETAQFVNVYSDGVPIATSRLVTLNGDEVLAGKIAVMPEYRNSGIGRHMLCELEKLAENEKKRTFHIVARQNAVGFYEKLGFVKEDEPFEKDNVVMYPVVKKL